MTPVTINVPVAIVFEQVGATLRAKPFPSYPTFTDIYVGTDVEADLTLINASLADHETRITAVEAAVITAQSVADTALANAATALATANEADDTADAAQSTANTALANAATALAAANEADDTADAAQSTANTALSTATIAESQANIGIADAATAYGLAETASIDAATAQATADAALAAAGGIAYPDGAFLMPDMAHAISGGFTAPTIQAGQHTGQYSLMTGLNSEVEFKILLGAGNYNISLTYIKTNSAGQIRVRVDGADIWNTLETYNATTQLAQIINANFPSTLSAGLHTINIKIPSKHASSSNYDLRLSYLAVRKI